MTTWISSSCLHNFCVAQVSSMKQSSFPARLYAHKTVMVVIILIKTFVTGIVPVPTLAALLSVVVVVMIVDLTHYRQWCHNEGNGISNHQPHDCLLNHLFRRWSKKTSKLRVTGLCVGNSPVTGEFPAQRASNADYLKKADSEHIRNKKHSESANLRHA